MCLVSDNDMHIIISVITECIELGDNHMVEHRRQTNDTSQSQTKATVGKGNNSTVDTMDTPGEASSHAEKNQHNPTSNHKGKEPSNGHVGTDYQPRNGPIPSGQGVDNNGFTTTNGDTKPSKELGNGVSPTNDSSDDKLSSDMVSLIIIIS